MRVSRKIFYYERKSEFDDWYLVKKYQTTNCDIVKISKKLLEKFDDIRLVPSFETNETVISVTQTDSNKFIHISTDMTPYIERVYDL